MKELSIMRPFPRTLVTLVLLLIIGVAMVGCGQPASAGGAAGGFSDAPAAQTVAVRVDPHGRLAWEQAEYTATAGDITFLVSSPAGLAHNFTIDGPGVKAQSPQFAGGTTNRFTLKGMQPGTYKLSCTVPGHHEAGMVATLHVR